MTSQEIMECLVEFLADGVVWDFDTPEEAQKLAFYNQGALDFAKGLLDILKGEEGEQ